MTVGLDELERTLSYSVFCDGCGYNLRGLRYVGQCPECANAYNARPLKLEGIYHAFDLKFPMWDMIVTLACAGMGGVTIVGSLNPMVSWGLVSGSAFVLLALAFAPTVYGDATRYLRFRGIIRRAALEEEDD